MRWFLIAHCFALLLELILLRRQSDQAKDLQILLLRRQLEIVQRKLDRPLRISRAEKFSLALLTIRLKRITGDSAKELRDVIRIFQPETVLKWHRELVRRKWTHQHRVHSGRPRTDSEVEHLVLQLARANDWGNGKIQGELRKLGIDISDQTVANILKRHGIPPLSQRRPSLSWRHLMTHYQQQIIACDFFTVETLFLQTLYVFFFIELGTRRVHFAGCTTYPTSTWVTQQARQFVWSIEQRTPPLRFIIHDRDSKFTDSFDAVFASEHIKIIRTPVRAPNANTYAERWVRSVREECLDKLLIWNETHLWHVMRDYVDYYNQSRPHQGIGQQTPVPQLKQKPVGAIRCRSVLGIINDYYRDAA